MIESQKRKNKATNPKTISEDLNQEITLRPESFSDFIGQKELIENLKVYIKAENDSGLGIEYSAVDNIINVTSISQIYLLQEVWLRLWELTQQL